MIVVIAIAGVLGYLAYRRSDRDKLVGWVTFAIVFVVWTGLEMACSRL